MVRFYVQLLIEFLFQLTMGVLKTTFIPSHAFIHSLVRWGSPKWEKSNFVVSMIEFGITIRPPAHP